MFKNITELRKSCAVCMDCELCKTRTNVVFGVGSENTELLFVGEGPGEQEDLKGEPFVGRAGKLLDTMLELIYLDRSKIYIANIVKCRPPKNRDPRPETRGEGGVRKVAERTDKTYRPEDYCLLGQNRSLLLYG